MVVTRESPNLVNIPAPSLPSEENDRPATKSFGNPPTAQVPPPTNAAGPPTSTHHTNSLSAAVPLSLPPISMTPFQRASSDFTLKATVYANESAKRSAPIPNPTVLSHRWNKAEVVTALPSSTDFDGPPTLVEPLAVHQSKDVVDTSSLLSTFGEPAHGETISTETHPTPEASQPTNPPVALPSPPNKSGPEAVALALPSIAVTPCHRTSSEAIFQSTSASGDEKEMCSTSASDRTATKHSGLIVATQLSGAVRQGSSLQASR
ncbi:hypothetical protein FRC01_005361 [Tulasnella sp. 417]|nr:hypothetical protein FRC01_005361 [Tulasnella sp. 417]